MLLFLSYYIFNVNWRNVLSVVLSCQGKSSLFLMHLTSTSPHQKKNVQNPKHSKILYIKHLMW